jgi:hypothetical protein
LAAAEEQPGAINDEIRSHLAFDPMVVVDLGGYEADDSPNPNVMYELGIRHAFGLPLVMMAWEGQALPFDVSNQRVIMEPRDLLALEVNKKKLVSFIKAAEEGKYYRPMEAVRRHAQIEQAFASLGDESLLGALAYEVKNLREIVIANNTRRSRPRPYSDEPTLKTFIRKREKIVRKSLYHAFEEAGGTPTEWAKILRHKPTGPDIEKLYSCNIEELISYLGDISGDLGFLPPGTVLKVDQGQSRGKEDKEQKKKEQRLSEQIIAEIKEALPPQPWPKGIHKEVAKKLNLTPSSVSRVIQKFIQDGKFLPQINGVLFKPVLVDAAK